MNGLPPARDMRTSFLGGPPSAAPSPSNGAPGLGAPPGTPTPAAPAVESPRVGDGRYAGGNHELAVELRVDGETCGIISGDLHRILPERHYVASFRTEPGVRIDPGAGSWGIVGQDEYDRTVHGVLALTVNDAASGALNGTLRFNGRLEGLPARQALPFVAQRQSSALRSLGLEIEIEDNVAPLGGYAIDSRTMTVEEALLAAGFETYTTGITDRIPNPGQGWDMSQLHTLMSDLAQASLLARAWELHLLLLSRSDRPGLLGVMFDSSDTLPRQGAAVFAGEIRAIQGIDHERKLIQTTVHELGHGLNLAHRFERVVGRADSTSFMNYDWRYRGGPRESEFWKRFAFTFDTDELEFLRHAPLAPVVPGGAAFHSVPYWADGDGGYSPYVPEAPLSGWELTLFPPAEGQVLQFAQPVFMEVMLTNRSGRAVSVPKFLLDPKAGFVEVLIRRAPAGAPVPGGQARAFTPVMQRCFQWDAADSFQLPVGASMKDNLNLTFGSGGFAFAEPGTYDVTVLLVLFDEQQQREFVARSNTVRVRIATPKSIEEETEALDFFTPDVGLYLSLGGTPTLPKARGTLESMVDRRRGDATNPLVAHMNRVLAIDASRTYVRYADGRFTRSRSVSAQEAEKAKGRLEAVCRTGCRTFGGVTARQTEALFADMEKGAPPRGIEPLLVAAKETGEAIGKAASASMARRHRPPRLREVW